MRKQELTMNNQSTDPILEEQLDRAAAAVWLLAVVFHVSTLFLI